MFGVPVAILRSPPAAPGKDVAKTLARTVQVQKSNALWGSDVTSDARVWNVFSVPAHTLITGITFQVVTAPTDTGCNITLGDAGLATRFMTNAVALPAAAGIKFSGVRHLYPANAMITATMWDTSTAAIVPNGEFYCFVEYITLADELPQQP